MTRRILGTWLTLKLAWYIYHYLPLLQRLWHFMTYLLEMPKSPLLKHTTPKIVPKVTATRTNVPITDPTIIACWVALSRLFPGGENCDLISANDMHRVLLYIHSLDDGWQPFGYTFFNHSAAMYIPGMLPEMLLPARACMITYMGLDWALPASLEARQAYTPTSLHSTRGMTSISDSTPWALDGMDWSRRIQL